MSDTILSVRAVTKVYQMGEVEVHALRHTDLDIYRGEILVVVGPSGSGKSTLLNIVGGMDRPTTGEVLFDGEDLAQSGERRLTEYRRLEVGFVFQFFNLVPTLTALENVQVASEIAPDPMSPMRALELVGLSERAGHFPSQLSGGEQQRVSIARALVKKPQLVLCDEPTGALDSETSRGFLQLLYDVNEDLHTTIVIITHDHTLAQAAHRVAAIRDGAIVKLNANDQRVPPAELEWT